MSHGAETNVVPQRSRWRRCFPWIGVLFIVAIVGYIEFKFRRPIGEGPAGPQVDDSVWADSAVWTKRSIAYIGIGDSITRGLGADRKSHTFFERLRINPPDEYDDMQDKCLSALMPNLTAVNYAVSGSTSLDHIDVINDQLPMADPNVLGLIVMTTGGNDLIHSYGRRPPTEGAMYGATVEQAEPWISNFRDRLKQMFDTINERFPGGCEIFVGDIYDPTDGVGDAPSIFLPPWPDGLAIHARYNAAIRQVARSRPNVHIVPLHETFLGHGSHCRQFWRSHYDASDPHYWFYTNIEDPNDRGYDAIRRVFLNTIIQQKQRLMAQPQSQVQTLLRG